MKKLFGIVIILLLLVSCAHNIKDMPSHAIYEHHFTVEKNYQTVYRLARQFAIASYFTASLYPDIKEGFFGILGGSDKGYVTTITIKALSDTETQVDCYTVSIHSPCRKKWFINMEKAIREGK